MASFLTIFFLFFIESIFACHIFNTNCISQYLTVRISSKSRISTNCRSHLSNSSSSVPSSFNQCSFSLFYFLIFIIGKSLISCSFTFGSQISNSLIKFQPFSQSSISISLCFSLFHCIVQYSFQFTGSLFSRSQCLPCSLTSRRQCGNHIVTVCFLQYRSFFFFYSIIISSLIYGIPCTIISFYCRFYCGIRRIISICRLFQISSWQCSCCTFYRFCRNFPVSFILFKFFFSIFGCLFFFCQSQLIPFNSIFVYRIFT